MRMLLVRPVFFVMNGGGGGKSILYFSKRMNSCEKIKSAKSKSTDVTHLLNSRGSIKSPSKLRSTFLLDYTTSIIQVDPLQATTRIILELLLTEFVSFKHEIAS